MQLFTISTYGFQNILAESTLSTVINVLLGPKKLVYNLLFDQIITIVSGIISCIYYMTALAINLMQSVSTVRLDAARIEDGWNQSIFYVNVIAVFILIAIALANALRLNIETYEIKKTLPGLIAGFILANLSLLFCKAVLDLSDIVTYQLASGNNAGGNLATVLIHNMTGVTINPGGTVSLGDSAVMAVFEGFKNFGIYNPDFSSSAIGAALGIGLLLMALIWFCIPAVLISIIALLMIIRYIILMVLVVVAPIAIIFYFFPPTKNLGQRWFDEFFKWAFLPPVVFFILRLSTFFSRDNQAVTKLNYEPINLPTDKEIQIAIKQIPSFTSLLIIETAHAQDTPKVEAKPDALETSAGNSLWTNILAYIAGVGIMIAAIFVPFQIGGIGGQMMNWVSNLGKGLAKRGVGELQLGERATTLAHKTPLLGSYLSNRALNKSLVTDSAKSAVEESTANAALIRYTNYASKYNAAPRGSEEESKYSGLMKSMGLQINKYTKDSHEAEIGKSSRQIVTELDGLGGDVSDYFAGNLKDMGKFKKIAGLLKALNLKKDSWNDDDRGVSREFFNDNAPGSNTWFSGDHRLPKGTNYTPISPAHDPRNFMPPPAAGGPLFDSENATDKFNMWKSIHPDYKPNEVAGVKSMIRHAKKQNMPKNPTLAINFDDINNADGSKLTGFAGYHVEGKENVQKIISQIESKISDPNERAAFKAAAVNLDSLNLVNKNRQGWTARHIIHHEKLHSDKAYLNQVHEKWSKSNDNDKQVALNWYKSNYPANSKASDLDKFTDYHIYQTLKGAKGSVKSTIPDSRDKLEIENMEAKVELVQNTRSTPQSRYTTTTSSSSSSKPASQVSSSQTTSAPPYIPFSSSSNSKQASPQPYPSQPTVVPPYIPFSSSSSTKPARPSQSTPITPPPAPPR